MSDQANTDRAEKFVHDHVERLRPLEIAASLAWWKANTTGKDEDFAAKEGRAQTSSTPRWPTRPLSPPEGHQGRHDRRSALGPADRRAVPWPT